MRVLLSVANQYEKHSFFLQYQQKPNGINQACLIYVYGLCLKVFSLTAFSYCNYFLPYSRKCVRGASEKGANEIYVCNEREIPGNTMHLHILCLDQLSKLTSQYLLTFFSISMEIGLSPRPIFCIIP